MRCRDFEHVTYLDKNPVFRFMSELNDLRYLPTLETIRNYKHYN